MRVGSLCSGIGGLDLGVGGELVFVSEIDPAPSEVLAARFPGVPNLGDWTTQDLPEVDLLIGGLPCQPVSTAGRRAGIHDERFLFDDLADAIGRMGTRPDVFLENVPGLLTASGGDAMARAVHGLASLGYVGRWRTVRASDIGAPHRRERWFCHARHPDQLARTKAQPLRPDERISDSGQRQGTGQGPRVSGYPDGQPAGRISGTVPRAEGAGRSDGGVDHRPDATRDAAADPDGSRITRARANASQTQTQPAYRKFEDCDRLAFFKQFGPAVARWEHILGRPAPDPLDGNRLNPVFVEWMMGFDAGWVTDILGRTASLRALGNAVVPHQAALVWGMLR